MGLLPATATTTISLQLKDQQQSVLTNYFERKNLVRFRQ
jgi:hypothetical protein